MSTWTESQTVSERDKVGKIGPGSIIIHYLIILLIKYGGILKFSFHISLCKDLLTASLGAGNKALSVKCLPRKCGLSTIPTLKSQALEVQSFDPSTGVVETECLCSLTTACPHSSKN